jgi:hypothetical protein
MNIDRLFSRSLTAGFAAVVLVLTGCAASTPTIDTSPEAEVTFDGLHEVKGGSADQAWARPGTDISQYSKIMLQGAGIEYRPGGESGRSLSARSRGGPYEVTEDQKARLRAVVAEEFLEELSKSEHFTIVSEPGPDVLLVRGAILDVVSWVPPEPIGRGAIYISEVGEATLVLELRDSITEAILARAVDRRAAESAMRMSESTRARNTAEVRRMVGVWARLLREGLDQFAAPKE